MFYFIVVISAVIVIGLKAKTSMIQEKIDKNENITVFENLIYNIVTGIEKIIELIIAFIIGFIIPICLLFVPSAFVLVQIAVRVSNDFIIPAIILAAVVAILMYTFMAIVIVSAYKKRVKKDENITK